MRYLKGGDHHKDKVNKREHFTNTPITIEMKETRLLRTHVKGPLTLEGKLKFYY